MEAKLQKHIIDFFSLFEEFFNAINSSLKNCQKCAISINKLTNKCRNIKETELKETPLGNFVGLQAKLCCKIHNLISEEVQEIKTHLYAVEELHDKLCYKQKILNENSKELDLSGESILIKGSPLQPPLKQLLEFSQSAVLFGSEIRAQIETSLEVLAIKGIQSTLPIDNFKISTTWLRTTKEIISYTSFCSENQL